MTLPYARKVWRCGEEWVNNELTINPEKGCGQDIYQSDKDKFSSGKYKVLNFKDGKGGLRNDPHVCPNRVGSEFHHFTPINMLSYDYHEQNKYCVICGNKFNSQALPLCPHCFKLHCRNCGNLQHWVVDKGASCFQCGGKTDVQQIFWSFMRYEREDKI